MNRKKPGIILIPLAILMAFFFHGTPALAQSKAKSLTLELTVLSDTDKQPVAGAACLLADYGIFAITDADGRAKLEKVPVGDATLSIQMLGFEDFAEMMRFRSDSTFTVRILESTLALEEVVVTAKSSAAGSSTSSNIGRMAIDHLQATSLKDVMQLIPGQLMQSSDMTSEAKITIRSASDNTANNAFGTSIMVDGVPVSDNTSLGTNAGTGVDLRQISADNIESVEVIRGIPSAEYGDLTELTELRINSNKLTGELPETLFELINLEKLYFQNNNLTGKLPASLSKLTNLIELYIDRNKNLGGTLPEDIGKLLGLTSINISQTAIGGSIPQSLSQCTVLKNLMAWGNNLSGEIPDFWDQLPNIGVLQLYGNPGITGPIPASMGSLKAATGIQLKECNLTGNIPASFGGLTKCSNLQLNGNKLSGVVPAEVQAHPKWLPDTGWKYETNILPQQEGYGLTLE